MEEREGGQGPPRSATGKTAINNLHHLSLCAPLDHSTNSTRNLRQKHTLARMQRFVCARSCINTHADTNVCVCMQVAAESRYNSPLHPESNSLLTQPLLSFRTWPQTSTHHTERVAQGPAFCLCGGHVKLMPVCHPAVNIWYVSPLWSSPKLRPVRGKTCSNGGYVEFTMFFILESKSK